MHGLDLILTARRLLFALLMVPASSLAAQEPVDLLVRGGTVVTMDADFRVFEDGAIAVRDGKLAAIGTSGDLAARYTAKRTLDARGAIIMPGLVNAHGHAAMSLFRGLADDRALMDWLRNYIFPAEAKLVDEAFVRAGTKLALLEMALGGTTTYVDMYYFEDAVADETAKAGLRGILGQTLIDFPAPDFKTWGAMTAATDAYLAKWKGHRLIVPAAAPHAPYTVSPEHLQEVKQLSDKHGAPILLHVAETKQEIETVREKYQATPVVHLDKLGLLCPQLIAKHVVWATDDELLLLKKHNVGVAHCPQSNMKLASGIAPIPKMLELKLAVGLGTDGPASNNDLDMWEEIDTAAKLHKVATGDPTVVSARQALAMATIDGARAVHMAERIGSLEVGKEADFILVGIDAPHQTPLYDFYSHLVYATKASDVRTVVVAGRVIVEDRKPATLDPDAIRRDALRYRDQIRTLLAK